MKRTISRFLGMTAAALVAAALSGCFWVEAAKSPVLGDQVEEHVTVSNYGWSLFGCVPLFCGNANESSWCPFTFFKDEVTPECVYDRLKAEAAAKNCELAEVSFLNDNDVLFDCFYTVVPWVLVYRECNLSANLVRKGGAK